MAVLTCAHGETFDFDSAAEAATMALCAYCCTPYSKGQYAEHCASSPSHLDEIKARAYDREVAEDLERNGIVR